MKEPPHSTAFESETLCIYTYDSVFHRDIVHVYIYICVCWWVFGAVVPAVMAYVVVY